MRGAVGPEPAEAPSGASASREHAAVCFDERVETLTTLDRIGERFERFHIAGFKSLARHADAAADVAHEPSPRKLVERSLVGERHELIAHVLEPADAEIARPIAADPVRPETSDERRARGRLEPLPGSFGDDWIVVREH